MRLNDLFSSVGYSTIVVMQKKTNPDIFAVRFFNDREKSLSENVLYFVRSSDVGNVAKRKGDASLSIVLLDDGAFEKEAEGFDNVFTVCDAMAFDEAFFQLESALARFNKMSAQIEEFMELLTVEDDMNVHIQWISDFFGFPACLLDNSFSYIAHSELSGFLNFDTNVLINELQQGYILDLDHVRRLQRDQKMTIFDGVSRPKLLWHEDRKFAFYHCPLRIGNATVGILSVFLPPEETLDALQLFFIEKIALLLRIVLQRNNTNAANKASFYTSFFSTMLSSHPDRSKNWESRLSSYGYVLQKNLHMVVVEQPPAFSTPAELNVLASSLHHMFPWSIYFVYNNKVLLLCGTEKETLSIPAVADKTDNFFAANYLKLGVSSVFHSIYDIAAYYEEAETALRIGSSFAPNRHFYFYDDLRLCDMVDRLAKNNSLSTFCYPPFMDLLYYDQQHDAQLCITLLHHLLLPKDPATVCQRLNIHKNTLYFRLQKIRSIMKVDPTSFTVASQIFITAIVLHYRQHGSEAFASGDYSALLFRAPFSEETLY